MKIKDQIKINTEGKMAIAETMLTLGGHTDFVKLQNLEVALPISAIDVINVTSDAVQGDHNRDSVIGVYHGNIHFSWFENFIISAKLKTNRCKKVIKNK